MEKLLLYIVLLIAAPFTTGAAQTDASHKARTDTPSAQRVVKLLFDETHIDLGKIKKGTKKSGSFGFINAGTEAIEIELVSACECTELDWPRLPVLPGERGSIDFIFDSSQKDKSETIEVDIYLKNIDPRTGNGVMEFVSYSYELVR